MATRLGQAFVTISAKMDQLTRDLAAAKGETNAAIMSMQAKMDSLNIGASSSGLSAFTSAAQVAAAAIIGMAAAAAYFGTQFNAQIESSTVGIASLLAAQGKFRDAQGNELSGRDKINAALGISSDLVKQLQVDNLKTTATFQQLINAFQVTLAPGLAKGLNVDQIRQYTVAMVQAAAAMQVPLDQMAEETRSLLTGTITPRNTRIATALGITPEDVKKWTGNADGWFKWVMGKLDAFKEFGGIQATTFSGLMSNIKDVGGNVLGAVTRPFFNELKGAMQSFYDYAVQVDEATGNIRLNPELINSLQILNDTLSAALTIAKGIGAALLAIGTGYSIAKEAMRTVGSQGAGFSSGTSEGIDTLTNTERLERVKQLMQDIADTEANIASANQAAARGDVIAKLYQGFQELNQSLNISALEAFRREMAQAGQDTSQVDTALRALKTSLQDSFANSDRLTEGLYGGLQNIEESFKRSDTLTDGLYSKISNVSYAIDRASMSADEFKKRLQEIAGINLDSIARGLDEKIVELGAKLKVAMEGGKTPFQNSAAEYAKTMVEAARIEKEATLAGADVFEAQAAAQDMRNKATTVKTMQDQLAAQNEANKEARKKGPTPVGYEQIDQSILKFTERVSKMYQELHGLSMDYEATRLEASGQYYAAEEVRIAKRVSDQKAAYAKEVADAQQAYTEMEQKLGGKRGATPEAVAALEELKNKYEALKSVAKEYGIQVDKNAEQDKRIFQEKQKLQGGIDLAQANVTYAQLTGTMEEQYKAQVALIEASTKEKVANASKDIPGLTERYRELGAEQARIKNLQGTGSIFDGMTEGLKEWQRTLPTAFDTGKQAIDAMKNSINSAADAMAEFTMTGKMNFSNFANSIIKDILKMAYTAMLNKAIGGILGFLGFGASSIPDIGPTFDNPIAWGTPKASGGPVYAGKGYLVGERGPEIFRPGASGSIIPNHKITGYGGGGLSVVNHISVTAPASSGGQQDPKTHQKLADTIALAVEAKVMEINNRERRAGGMWNKGVNG